MAFASRPGLLRGPGAQNLGGRNIGCRDEAISPAVSALSAVHFGRRKTLEAQTLVAGWGGAKKAMIPILSWRRVGTHTPQHCAGLSSGFSAPLAQDNSFPPPSGPRGSTA